MFVKSLRPHLLACALALASLPLQAANNTSAASAASAPAMVSEQAQKINAIEQRAIPGPKTIDLGEEGTLNLPKGMKFIAKDDANTLMEIMGNAQNPQRYGVIFPEAEEVSYWFDLSYADSGYIKDDDAKDWDIDHMMKSLREGTDEQNTVRQSQGIPEIEIIDWIEKPTYDATQHRLVWSVDLRDKGAPAGSDTGVNYNTFLLGRKGFINLTLITDGKHIEQYKPTAKDLLASIEFKQGLRYADFNAATDKVAEYGLAALVGGVAAKKLGLFAMLGVLFAKFGKFIVLGGIAALALLKRFFKRGDKEDDK